MPFLGEDYLYHEVTVDQESLHYDLVSFYPSVNQGNQVQSF